MLPNALPPCLLLLSLRLSLFVSHLPPLSLSLSLHLSFYCQASLFVFGSHNKKRPHNVVLGRMYDGHVRDMVELGLESLRPMMLFPAEKNVLGSKPCLVRCTPFSPPLQICHGLPDPAISSPLLFSPGHLLPSSPNMSWPTRSCHLPSSPLLSWPPSSLVQICHGLPSPAISPPLLSSPGHLLHSFTFAMKKKNSFTSLLFYFSQCHL
jgi:hypothetical protein